MKDEVQYVNKDAVHFYSQEWRNFNDTTLIVVHHTHRREDTSSAVDFVITK